MKDDLVRSISAGLSQKGVRDHNERLLLSLIQRHGALPASDLSRLAELSAPTVSTILRRLEAEGLVRKGAPVRGKVGKPSTPMHLSADGAFSFGLKIGRRSADLVLLDLTGAVRQARQITYAAPVFDDILTFTQQAVTAITQNLTEEDATRICGIGVAAPFEIWSWPGTDGARPAGDALLRGTDIQAEIFERTHLPVSLMNDATAACQAEHTYGRGKGFTDYAYFFIGAFIGGGIVLNNAVVEGRQGNAGALGSLRTVGPNGESRQLVDMASIHQLEKRLKVADIDPQQLWTDPQSWSRLRRQVDPWLGQTAQELARAALSTCAVFDFEAILIDGAFPETVRNDLVARVRRYVGTQDARGLIIPQIEAGTIGSPARAMGAASRPISGQFMLGGR